MLRNIPVLSVLYVGLQILRQKTYFTAFVTHLKATSLNFFRENNSNQTSHYIPSQNVFSEKLKVFLSLEFEGAMKSSVSHCVSGAAYKTRGPILSVLRHLLCLLLITYFSQNYVQVVNDIVAIGDNMVNRLNNFMGNVARK